MKKKFHETDILVYEDFESFIAEIPEMPGYIASGLTATEAIQNLHLHIQELETT